MDLREKATWMGQHTDRCVHQHPPVAPDFFASQHREAMAVALEWCANHEDTPLMLGQRFHLEAARLRATEEK